MATVAGPGSFPPDKFHSGGGGGGASQVGTKLRRKTPSELRGEQLKRVNIFELVDESAAPLHDSLNNHAGTNDGPKKPEVFKLPRYIDTRVSEVYPAKKSKFKMSSLKENVKETSTVEQSDAMKNLAVLSDMASRSKQHLQCPEDSTCSLKVAESHGVQTQSTLERCNQSRFRTVAEISSSSEKLSSLANIDMDKALKGLAAREPSSQLRGDCSENFTSGNFCSQYNIVGQRAPLDFTLKTVMCIATTSSVNWIYRLITNGSYSGIPNHTSLCACSEGERISNCSRTHMASTGFCSTALNSWIYPQSTLPLSLMSVLTSPAAEKAEMDFLKKRQLSWEESFRSLYYLFRKNSCSIFYVCTSQFVVMFTADGDSGSGKRTCSAYVSRSTRGLRSLFREHDLCFSMPLCHSKVEQLATEDLVELSEIEKHNLGQTRRPSSSSDIDNTPQSLLAFSGNKDVHGLYDLLLNYRSFLTFLTGVDVPVLYSPIPFQNAAVSAPEVRCMEMRPANHIADSIKEDGSLGGDSTAGLRYTLEITDAYIPPWIICNICTLLGSQGRFEASFVTENASIGLNAVLGTIFGKCDSEDLASEVLEKTNPFGISEATVTPHLRLGLLKNLKYCDGSYTASVSPA
ncbi:hypothetical protein BT93_L1678 [Corymbia citriodora subsp. variegata]|uniref:Protein downstream neighbor of Son n=1 Tax=Corymbia citriodora subsp. variegata TaxID=360336 RepID=A0A8T0CZ90_CORYI|nr:hypothetical protein BT93_L1678 [Corymbia citriodora subsp. variegata]